MKTILIVLMAVLFLTGLSWAQNLSFPAKTSETLVPGDCFVLKDQIFEYGLIFSESLELSEGMDTTFIGTKVYSFIPILLNYEEEGLEQILQGSINIRCLDMEGPQCGYYEFQSFNKNGTIDTVLNQLTYVGTVNFPTTYHTDMAGGGNILDAASFKSLFDEYWQEDIVDGDDWKRYLFFDVLTLRKGLTYRSFLQD